MTESTAGDDQPRREQADQPTHPDRLNPADPRNVQDLVDMVAREGGDAGRMITYQPDVAAARESEYRAQVEKIRTSPLPNAEGDTTLVRQDDIPTQISESNIPTQPLQNAQHTPDAQPDQQNHYPLSSNWRPENPGVDGGYLVTVTDREDWPPPDAAGPAQPAPHEPGPQGPGGGDAKPLTPTEHAPPVRWEDVPTDRVVPPTGVDPYQQI